MLANRSDYGWTRAVLTLAVTRVGVRGVSLPVFSGMRTSSPANPGASPGVAGAAAAGKSTGNTGAEGKGKGKKRKGEAAGGTAGEEG